jgi:hypothetical protein
MLVLTTYNGCNNAAAANPLIDPLKNLTTLAPIRFSLGSILFIDDY